MRIGILTGGGDAPGLNAVIRAATRSIHRLGWEAIGIRNGFDGLLTMKGLNRLDPKDISGILHEGGTILGTSNRANPFSYPVKRGNRTEVVDRSREVVRNFKRLRLDGLLVIGGDGSLGIARDFLKLGLPVVGVPKTIDNDVRETDVTFGFDTAVATATDALDRLHSTAESHQRVMVVEVMGRYCGWIALHAGIAGGADVILIPEIPFSLEAIHAKVRDRYRRKQNFCIIVVAEGATAHGGTRRTQGEKELGREVRLGGVAEWLAREIQQATGRESRSIVLGHLQRGGSPSTFDRLLATRLGAAAVRAIQDRKFGSVVCLRHPDVVTVPIARAIAAPKTVPPRCDSVRSARQLGISFGDESPADRKRRRTGKSR